MQRHRLVLAITGASGAIYSKVLMQKLQQLGDQVEKVGVIMSDNAKTVWEQELGDSSYKDFDFTFYGKNDFFAPFASGSARYNTMIVCPCSMGTLARIASGISNDLITRAADVILKERRKLILVENLARETPFKTFGIHINNMKTVIKKPVLYCVLHLLPFTAGRKRWRSL